MNIEDQLRAFRDTLAYAEGTDKPAVQNSNFLGYDVIVGGSLFSDFSKHPNKLVHLPRYNISSSAAGRYQFIRTTWNALVKKLGLVDFTPKSQDAACNELLRECGARARLAVGDFAGALKAGNKIWASLPGSPHGQRIEDAATLRAIFVSRGGVVK